MHKDFTLERSVWFSSLGKTDYLAHIVARDMIRRAMASDTDGLANLLTIVRRYE